MMSEFWFIVICLVASLISFFGCGSNIDRYLYFDEFDSLIRKSQAARTNNNLLNTDQSQQEGSVTS